MASRPALGRQALLHNPSPSKVVCALATILFMTLFSTAAFAQSNEERMQELVEQAATAFSEKRYADSAQLFEQANEAQPNPTLLKNAMVAWYKGQKCGEAVHAGAKFYREAQAAGQLEAKDQSEIQTVISCSLNLVQQRIDEGKYSEAEDLLFTATSAGPTTEQTERIASLRDTLRQKRDAEDKRSAGGGDPIQSEPKSAEAGMSGLALTGWAMTGVGVAGLAGSVVYALTAAGEERDAISTCETQNPPVNGNDLPDSFYTCVTGETGAASYDEVKESVDGAQSTSVILYSVSGAVTAIGLGILVYHYFLTPSEEAAPSVMVAPMLGPDTAGAQLQWRF